MQNWRFYKYNVIVNFVNFNKTVPKDIIFSDTQAWHYIMVVHGTQSSSYTILKA